MGQCFSSFETPGVEEFGDWYKIMYAACFYLGWVTHWAVFSFVLSFSGKTVFGDFGQDIPYNWFILGFVACNIAYVFGYCWMKSGSEYEREYLLIWLVISAVGFGATVCSANYMDQTTSDLMREIIYDGWSSRISSVNYMINNACTGLERAGDLCNETCCDVMYDKAVNLAVGSFQYGSYVSAAVSGFLLFIGPLLDLIMVFVNCKWDML